MSGKGGFVDDGWCYVCGKQNPEGMKLAFTVNGREVETSYRAEKRHQGYKDVLHGGYLAMLMDEVLVYLPFKVLGVWSVTAEMTFRLIKPVKTGQVVRARAFFLSDAGEKDRVFRVGAECTVEDGTVVARSEGKCVRI
jgi:acyl-coenzyme A thioesterase PaaI-like protein